MRCKFSSFQWDPSNLACTIWYKISNSNFQNEVFFFLKNRIFNVSALHRVFFVKTWFWTFSALEWIFLHPKNLKIIWLTKEFLLILAIFGKSWKKESKFGRISKNFFRMCIPNYGLRMKIFNFISRYFNFFVLFFNSSSE